MPISEPRPSTRRQWNAWLDLTASFKYLGIYQAIVADIENGRLQPGDSLPPQRTLAKLLGVDLTTVTKAYGMARDDGLIETRTGSGTCVAGETRTSFPTTLEAPMLDLSKNSPPRTEGQEINALIVKEMGRAFATIGDVASFNYQETGGNLRHRVAGASWLTQRIEQISADRVILTSGAQSALFAICHLLSRTSRSLAVGQFCYPGIHTVARQLGLDLVPVSMDAEGLIPEDFEQACQRHALMALYVVPNIDNPTTATLPEARRLKIAEIARRHRVTLIEDDPYSNIAANGLTSLAQLAPELTWHIATLSKCATPALRLAYLCAPDIRSAQEIAGLMQAMTMMVSPLFAELASQWIDNGILQNLTQAIRAENAARLLIAGQVFADLNFSAPPQGSHIWLHLPQPWQALDFAHQAERQHIKLLPASSFSPASGHRPSESVRISLGAADNRQMLEEGLKRLRDILDQPLAFYQAMV
ncbi:PLP-dependent aminotransferase family protein [Pseudomonas sp. RC10]|uniref:aminotransferase-like domain-containing protein n=1 Tax=Pseudomonas bambusae TaxID=3139142 RepID=UPI0031390A6A